MTANVLMGTLNPTHSFTCRSNSVWKRDKAQTQVSLFTQQTVSIVFEQHYCNSAVIFGHSPLHLCTVLSNDCYAPPP